MAQDQEKSRSVFDFLYVDQQRLQLYLAQFSEFGNLTGLVRSVSESHEHKLAGSLHVIKGAAKSDETSELEKHYDPRWIAPLTFLEEIRDREILKRDAGNAQIGDFVILKGQLILVDVRALEGAFKAAGAVEKPLPSAKGNRHERRAAAATGQSPYSPPSASDLGDLTPFKMMASLEQPIIMHFTSGNGRFGPQWPGPTSSARRMTYISSTELR